MASSVETPDVAKPIKSVEDLPSEERDRAERLRGFLRSRFRKRQSEYSELREALNQANMPVTYYDYLAKTYIYSAAVGVVSILLAVVVSAFLITSGSLDSRFFLRRSSSTSSTLCRPPSRTFGRSSSSSSWGVSQPV